MIENKSKVLSVEHVASIFRMSESTATSWFPLLSKAMNSKQINTVYRMAGFLATLSIESGNLQTFAENLNYSASRLLQVFPKYFNNDNASQYAGQPAKIANRVYGGRMGNGPELSGDGWLYRGRGAIQLTGKSNYQDYQRSGSGVMSNPDTLTSKSGAIESAAWFWQSKALNSYADRSDVPGMRRKVNGGSNGLSEFTIAYENALKVLSGVDPEEEIETDPESENSSVVLPSESEEWVAVPKARTQKIVEPITPGKSVYPYNSVHESRSGHVIEVDDTPDRERLQWYHRTGTYTEMQPDGNLVSKSVRERHDYCKTDRFHQTGGNYTSKVGGDTFYKVSGSITTSVGSKYTLEAPGGMSISTPQAKFSQEVICKDFKSKTATVGQLTQSKGIANLKAKSALHADRASRLGGPPPAPSFGMPSTTPGGVYNPPDAPLDGATVGFYGPGDRALLIQPISDLDCLVPGSSNTQVGGDIIMACGGQMTLHAEGGINLNGLAFDSITLKPTSGSAIQAPSTGAILFFDSDSGLLSFKTNSGLLTIIGV